MKKILIIEDNIDVRKNIITLLSEEGYNVLSAKDGESGIKLAKEEIPDLIICDIIMHGINGYDVLDELSKNKLTEAIQFIFLTAKADSESIRLGMQLGADDYLTKPFNFDELLKSIETRLRKAEAYKTVNNIPLPNSTTEKYSFDDKIFVRSDGNPVLIKVNEIIFIKAENQYTSISMLNDKVHLVRKPLSHWEKSLPQKNFYRIHRGTIINLDYLVKIEKWYNTSFLVYLKDVKEPFVISKRYSMKIRQNLL